MYINFSFHGSIYKADLSQQGNDKIVVKLKDENLGKQFGTSLPFYVQNHSVEFDILNRSHSDLFALNSSISKAISEQCREIL